MITIPRPFLRAFRALSRKCVAGRPRGPAPPVAVHHDRGAAVLVAHHGEVVLTGRVPGPVVPFEPFVLPGDVLDAADDPGGAAVAVAVSGRRAEVRRGDRVRSLTATPPDAKQGLPPEPKAASPVPAAFAAALHAAGRTTGRGGSRFALDRVQVRGASGDVIASDGTTLYWRTGFTLPFAEPILVPAVPLFGAAEWAKAATVCVGRTKDQLFVRAGPWAAYLAIDAVGRFPDVAAVVPRTPTPTTLVLDPADAAEFAAGLPTLPGNDDDKRPVTLDLAPGRPAVVRGRDEGTGDTAALTLSRSAVTNGPSRVAVDRAFLLRAVALGCSTVRVVGSDKPVVATGDNLTWMAASLHPDLIVPADAAGPPSPATSSNRSPSPVPEDRPAMKLPEQNGHARDRADVESVGDPLAEAEAVRSLLFEATQAAGRLVALLKAKKKEQRALASVYSSLKSLNLGP